MTSHKATKQTITLKKSAVGRALRTSCVLAIVIVIASLYFSGTGQVGAQEPPTLPLGSKAPAFITRTIDGKMLSLADLRGKVVLVDFWATWCGPCQMATPMLERLQKKFGGRGLRIVGLSLDAADSRDQLIPFQKYFGVTYTLCYDPDANVRTAMAYHINMDPNTGEILDHPVPPSVILIDRRGRVQWTQIGYSPQFEEPTLITLIQKLTAR
jgi:thiol-disulfide isomerase/thioredoxin